LMPATGHSRESKPRVRPRDRPCSRTPRSDTLDVDIEEPEQGRGVCGPAAPPDGTAAEQRFVASLGGGYREHLGRIAQNLQRGTAVVRQDRSTQCPRLREHEAKSLGDDEVGEESAKRRAHLRMNARLRLGTEILHTVELRGLAPLVAGITDDEPHVGHRSSYGAKRVEREL